MRKETEEGDLSEVVAGWFEPAQEGRPFPSAYILWHIMMDLDQNGSILSTKYNAEDLGYVYC